MATTGRTAKGFTTGDKEQRFGELIAAHRRTVMVVGVLVLVALGGVWFYRRSVELKRQRADTAYFQARRALEAGDLQLAVSDLRNVATRYRGTPGGTQAALALAEALYGTGKYQEGVAALLAALEGTDAVPDYFAPTVHSMIAVGLENLNQLPEAAREYQLAADRARFPKDRSLQRAQAARVLAAAGRTVEAVAILRELAEDSDQAVAAEARLKLGELTARPAGPG